MRVVVKVGTSSITNSDGALDRAAIRSLAAGISAARQLGHEVMLVSSAAIAAGLPALGLSARDRPKDSITLQAVSAVGQTRLMETYNSVFAECDGTVCGQVLLAPLDFTVRAQYLHARSTLLRLVELGVVPIINENDAIADDEIRFGDNDRIAALVAQLVDADLLVLLTDEVGVLSADPRVNEHATLIEEIVEFDQELEAVAGGSGSNRGSGGMATKLAAAKMASWSGIRAVIAAAHRPEVITDAIAGVPGVGTTVAARESTWPARKLWIAFAVASSGSVTIDEGAARALARDASLLAVGVTAVDGDFGSGDPIEVKTASGEVVAKGLVRVDAGELRGGEVNVVVVHRDDLVWLGPQR